MGEERPSWLTNSDKVLKTWKMTDEQKMHGLRPLNKNRANIKNSANYREISQQPYNKIGEGEQTKIKGGD